MRYTVLLRDPGDGHVCEKRSFDCPADPVATDRIARASFAHDVELWQEGRLVAYAAMSSRRPEGIEALDQPRSVRPMFVWSRLCRAVQSIWRTPATP